MRRFYTDRKYQKAGTEDLRVAFEQVSSVPLTRFFDRYIHSTGLPDLAFTYRLETVPDNEGASVVKLRFEQRTDELYDVPVTVRLRYTTGSFQNVVVSVTDRVTEVRVPLAGSLSSVDVNRDFEALARIVDENCADRPPKRVGKLRQRTDLTSRNPAGRFRRINRDWFTSFTCSGTRS